jgi:hypothetical protein
MSEKAVSPVLGDEWWLNTSAYFLWLTSHNGEPFIPDTITVYPPEAEQ